MSDFVEQQRLHAETERMAQEAAADRKAAEEAQANAQYLLGQVEHRRREITETEKSVAKRERALKAAGEPEFLARLAEADDKLKQAQELMQAYDREKHAAAIYLRQCSEREKAREVVAH